MEYRIELSPFHKYPDIFESATFSFGIPKFSGSHIIGFVADLLFSTLESGFKTIRTRVTETISGKKKLRIQKYPDMCRRDIELHWAARMWDDVIYRCSENGCPTKAYKRGDGD